ncbi:SDR family oxidoreductase [Niabella aquatica]
MQLKNRTAFITGASRGIGKAIALRLAKEGANIVVAAKSVKENEKLGGTIFTAAEEIEAAGGKALAVPCDVRDEALIQDAVAQTISRFGGIDMVINNASAITLTKTGDTPTNRFDLMQDINVRGTFLVTKNCLPHLSKSDQAHILTLSPPLNLCPQWLGAHMAYTISKYNMTMMALGWAEEFKNIPIASNALWPCTTIDTAAVRNLLGGQALVNMSRKPGIVADAAFYIVSRKPQSCTGNSFTDEQVLRQNGITDFASYAVVKGAQLYRDLFLDE